MEPPVRPERLAALHEVLGQLSPSLFVSLPRNDQRQKAERYVQGLLAAEGRKTLRNIAAQLGGKAAQQSVHHFISGSSWEWQPIRRSLAWHAQRLVRPQAWVVRALVIPKAGAHSVGVEQVFVPHLGQTVNGQRAFGAWMASERCSVPFNWSLALPKSWLADAERRSRVHIPADARAATLEEYVGGVVPHVAEGWRLRRRPVILDVEGLDPGEVWRGLRDAGAPLFVRIRRETPLQVDAGVLPGYAGREVTAGQLVDSVRHLRRRVEWTGAGGERAGGVAAVIPGARPYGPPPAG
ncbi:IS701 family transposase, partial [Streptomyces stramineus]|uniref:IS701 family transposase n=1 Tax=Streptomyces stramineus TaxID=173861 RepID=UPI0031D1C335